MLTINLLKSIMQKRREKIWKVWGFGIPLQRQILD